MIHNLKIFLPALLALTILYPAGSASAASPFPDMKESDWFYYEVSLMESLDITSGYPDKTFRPQNSLTRAEAAVFFDRVLDFPEPENPDAFPDVSKNSFAREAIASASEAGFMNGFPDGRFGPDQTLTREQMAVLIDRAYALQEASMFFNDLPEKRYSYDAVRRLAGSGITSGYPDGTFRPANNVTRAEFSVFLIRSIFWEAAGSNKEANTSLQHFWLETETSDLSSRETVERLERQLYELTSSIGSGFHTLVPLKKLEEAVLQQQAERGKSFSPVSNRLLSDWGDGSFMTRVFEHEAFFAQNNYHGATEEEEDFHLLEAEDSRILVTAPHTTVHLRENMPKVAEVYTGAIARMLHDYLDVNVMYTTRKSIDSNYYNTTAFKETMAEHIRANDINLVIDLHGAARYRDFDLDAGTDGGSLASPEKVNSLMSSLRAHGIYDVYENHTFTAGYSGTIAHFSRNELNTEAVQLEINRNYRDPRTNPEQFFNMFYGISEFLYLQENE
ncbi:S-layer homology domain-containing protein [Alkalicoccus halolimnae]|uniref:S-layer homology domain-containing protein n=1 Tax=Alkalicoccus halolimnae TaxID=1667239 RepID=A0AAJ8LV81_9BACI|nr:S-layer homology domain-containing protein [Alkalicoccus halolimnae]